MLNVARDYCIGVVRNWSVEGTRIIARLWLAWLGGARICGKQGGSVYIDAVILTLQHPRLGSIVRRNDGEWEARLNGCNAAQPPSVNCFADERVARCQCWQVIRQAESHIVRYVEASWSPIDHLIQRIGSLQPCRGRAIANVLLPLRIVHHPAEGVGGLEIQSVTGPLGEHHLQRVVTGIGHCSHVDGAGPECSWCAKNRPAVWIHCVVGG